MFTALRDGGLTLTETHARLLLNDFDYDGLSPRGFKNAMLSNMQVGFKKNGIPLERKQFARAYDSLTRLYVLYGQDPDFNGDPASVHHAVSVAVGKGLLDCDKQGRTYPIFDGIVDAERRKLGKTVKEMDELAGKWVEQLLVDRRRDQETAKKITRAYLLEHFGGD